MVFLEDGEVAVLEAGGFSLSTLDGTPISASREKISWSPVMAEKAGYKHFMLKEIFEQPRALEDTSARQPRPRERRRLERRDRPE